MLLYSVDDNRLQASGTHLGLPYHPDSVVEVFTGCVRSAKPTATETQLLRPPRRSGFIETQRA